MTRLRVMAMVAAAAASGVLSAAGPAEKALADTVGAPVVQTTAVVIVPNAPSRPHTTAQVTVSLSTPTGTHGEVTVEHNHAQSGSSAYVLDTSVSGPNSGSGSSGALQNVRSGDHIEIRLTVSENTSTGDINKLVAVRVVDLRTNITLSRSGTSTLLRGAPTVPTSSTNDLATTAATWGQGWPGVTAGLDTRTGRGGPPAMVEGVTQKGADFYITDRANPTKPVAVGTRRLDTRPGDRIVVEASTPPTGRHTAITVIDRRNHDRIGSPG